MANEVLTNMNGRLAVEMLTHAYDALERASTHDELCEQIKRFSKEMGFVHCAYALKITMPSLKPQCYLVNGYPQQWLDTYLRRDYFAIDPLVLHARHSTVPAIWDERRFHGCGLEEFWEEASGFGLTSGLSFYAHEPPGVVGIFSLARDRAIDHRGNDLAALIGRGQMLATLVHHAACRVMLPNLLPQSSTALTARERECLKWSADGKTAWELGQILGISARTAVFHLNNAMQKLGAANKIQAIVRAVVLRLI